MNAGDQPAILAFNDPYHDSSFCLHDGNGIVHVEMERFTRRKYETLNPIVGFCQLYPDSADRFRFIAIEEGDFLAPLVRRIIQEGSQLIDDPAALAALVASSHAVPLRAGDMDREWSEPDALQIRNFARHLVNNTPEIFFCGHHMSHAANAFFSSGMQSALTITLDGGGFDYSLDPRRAGERREIHGGVYECTGTSIKPVSHLESHSFGLAWTRVTEMLGLLWGEQGTVMAMAALGDPERFRELFARPFFWMPHSPSVNAPSAGALADFLAAVRKDIVRDQDRYDMAAALQLATEDGVRAYLKQFVLADQQNLCVAGGTFLNCQLLGKIAGWFPQLREIFIPPAPYDGGISVGAAQLVLHHHLGFPPQLRAEGMAPFAMGRAYSRSEILAACQQLGLTAHPVEHREVLDVLDRGGVIGLFNGAAESGRRALGHRSIVADPRRAEAKRKLNEIKHRQWFRPLAPMVLAEHVGEWFECGESFESPYMSFAVPIRQGLAESVPAIAHLDGTARVQTVHPGLSPVIHGFLSSWHERTGVPMLVNTSFNDREPVVETPSDALRTFLRVGIDCLYFIDCALLVSKT
jgi:carbamoyltransferase